MTPIELIEVLASRGFSPRKMPVGYQARCPAHDDRNPSLSIREGNDGRILLHCHAGCAVDAIVGKLDLKVTDLFPAKAHQAFAPAPRIVKTYDYTDETGAVLFQCVRYEPKDFRQRRPDPTNTGKWIWSLKDVRRVLFCLPDLRTALAAGRTIFVAEGEKDVTTLVQQGFVATTNAMGAGKWHPDHTEALRDAVRVVVIADKDAPGRKHGNSVATALHGVAKNVKLIELPDRAAKTVKDATDWFAAGGTREELQAIVKAASDFVPVPLATAAPAASSEVQADLDWPDPQPLPDCLPPVLPFDFACLPDTLRPWLEDIADRMQCPPDFAAVGAVLALGSVIGRRLGIRPKQHDDWLVICNLWGYIVGRPGLMKSPALEQALSPLRRLGVAELDRYEAAMKEHQANAMLEKQRAKLTEQSIAKHLRDGNENAARNEALTVVNDPYAEPILRRYEVNDSTVEKLGELLAQNPNGLLVYRDELVGLLRGLDREGNEQARAIYLEAWNGTGEFTYDRIGRGTVRVPSNTISVAGGIQPGLLTGYVREAVQGGMGADGLLQRFQVAAWPDPPKAWRNVDRWPDTKAKSEAFAVFQYLATLTPGPVEADQSEQIPFLRFTPDAQEQFNCWRAELEQTTRTNHDHEAFENHIAKYRKLIPAMALILHLSNRGTGPVTCSALERALLWARYLESHARRIYATALQSEFSAARELARRLERGELGPTFTVRELYRKHWTGLDSKEDADAATEVLSELGWLRLVQTDGSSAGRPSSQTLSVNPKIHEGALTVSAKIDKTPETRVLALLAPASTPSSANLEAPAMPATITATVADASCDEPVESPAELLL